MATNDAITHRYAVSPSDRSGPRSAAAFFALTLAVSWLAWTPAVLSEFTARSAPDALVLPSIVAGGFGPAVAAVVMTWRGDGRVRDLLARVVAWRRRPRWYLFALGVPLAFVAAGTALYAALGNPIDLSVLPARLAAFPIQLSFALVLGGGQEELGWRGYALPRLQARYGGAAASAVVGVAWAVWHLPLFAAPASSQYGQAFLPYAVAVVGFSVLLTWLYNGTGGSLLLAVVMHAAINATSSLYPIPADALAGGFSDVLTIGVALAAWSVALGLVWRDGLALDPRSR